MCVGVCVCCVRVWVCVGVVNHGWRVWVCMRACMCDAFQGEH